MSYPDIFAATVTAPFPLEDQPVTAPPEAKSDWLTTAILCAGVIAVMLAALSLKVFELDRYFVPKELVLNAAALLLIGVVIARPKESSWNLSDGLVGMFLLWSIASALFATNHWLAQRALAVTLSSLIIYWSARRVRSEKAKRLLINVAALASVVAAVTSLAQAYGFETDYFTLARAPGGTLGNRNFIAHIVAIGLPCSVWCTATARKPIGALLWSFAVAGLAATLVLSRSRAAYLAVIATVIVCGILLMVSRRYWRATLVGGRLARMLLVTVIGSTIAVIIPNELDWNSDSPYLDSARNVVDYSSGSGRGRIAQYKTSLKVVQHDPVFGAGPGNWPVRYPKYAPVSDKSLADNGMTANPWPSSDWVAFLSERGAIAAVSLLAFFAAVFFGSLRKWKETPDRDAILLRIALAGTVVATMVVSLFDAVLLLPAPAFLIWMILGAASTDPRVDPAKATPIKTRRLLLATVFAMSIINVTRSAGQVAAMWNVGTGGQTAGWVAGAKFDPGSFRINQRAAELYSRRGQCGKARPYIRRAVDLFPSSPPARRLARRCGVKL
jgi:O-antigen ligase